MNYPYGFLFCPTAPEYANMLSTMTPAIYFTEPPCVEGNYCGELSCSFAPLPDGSLFYNCGYIIPSKTSPDYNEEPDLPWYP